MPSLTLAMLIKDEAHCLADCLQSAAPIADELLVGDTGSTDDSREIARRYGARVIEVPWSGDFAAARNRVLARATGDWILHLDADEMLDAPGAARIRQLVDADGALAPGVPAADAIELTLANYCDEIQAWRWRPVPPDDPMARGYAGYIAAGLCRLFRNGRGFHYREPVHENIAESVLESGGVIRAEPVLIHHYGYAGDDEKRRRKSLAYLEIARDKVRQRPTDAKSWHDLAELALACGLTGEAEQACRRALELVPAHIQSVMTLATILLNRGDLDGAEAVLAAVAADGAAPPHAFTALGAIALRQGRITDAMTLLETALEADPHAPLAMLHLARAHDCAGNPLEAQNLLQLAFEVAPASDEVARRHQAHAMRTEAENLLAAGKNAEALALLTESLRLDPDDPVTYVGLGRAMAGLKLYSRAQKMFQNALRLVHRLPAAERAMGENMGREGPDSAV